MSASHLASHVVRHKQGRRSIQRTHGRLNARLMRDFVMRWAIWAVATSAYASAHAHVHKGRPLGVHQYPTPHSCAAGARTCAHTMPHSILRDRTACPAGSPLGRQRRKQPPPPTYKRAEMRVHPEVGCRPARHVQIPNGETGVFSLALSGPSGLSGRGAQFAAVWSEQTPARCTTPG